MDNLVYVYKDLSLIQLHYSLNLRMILMSIFQNYISKNNLVSGRNISTSTSASFRYPSHHFPCISCHISLSHYIIPTILCPITSHNLPSSSYHSNSFPLHTTLIYLISPTSYIILWILSVSIANCGSPI